MSSRVVMHQVPLIFSVAALFVVQVIKPATGDIWAVAREREFMSERANAVAVIRPHPNGSGEATASVYCQGPCGRTLFWSGPLVNEQAPVDAVVSDDGRTLVTFDEWTHLGTHAVVIYDKNGRRLADHNYSDFCMSLSREARPAVTSSGVHWRNKCIALWGPRNGTLCLRFPAGTVLVFDLSTGEHLTHEEGLLAVKRDEAAAYVRRELPRVAVKMLTAKSAQDREIGALLAGQLNVRDAIEGLRVLLKDGSVILVAAETDGSKWTWKRVYFVRKAAREALEAMGLEVGPVLTEEPEKEHQRQTQGASRANAASSE